MSKRLALSPFVGGEPVGSGEHLRLREVERYFHFPTICIISLPYVLKGASAKIAVVGTEDILGNTASSCATVAANTIAGSVRRKVNGDSSMHGPAGSDGSSAPDS